ncbi:MAG: hypothetical protein PHI29_02260 [Gallionella sp.]|nr:hypothetical protein [Gallionella sp.]
MKVGSAGSTPDNTTKPINAANQGSLARQELLNRIGENVANLNTIVVGLAAVENGAEKPDGLDISWNPTDRQAAARKARKAAIEAAMIQASEAINQYIYAVSNLPRFKTLRDKWKENDASMAERFVELANAIDPNHTDFEVFGVALMIHWRNRLVHSASSADLKHHEKKHLRDHEEEVATKYANLKIDCLLCHFQEKRPTLKDVSSLIAMTINIVNRIDKLIYICNTKEEVDAWLKYYGIDLVLEKVEKQTAKHKLNDSIRRTLLTRAPQLVEPYFTFNICSQGDGI